jgi:hypothetical protein
MSSDAVKLAPSTLAPMAQHQLNIVTAAARRVVHTALDVSRDPLDSVMLPPPDQNPDKSANGPCSASPEAPNSDGMIADIVAVTKTIQACIRFLESRN